MSFYFVLTSIPAAYAEGDTICNHRFKGTTNFYGENAGLNYFDSHGTAAGGDAATGGGIADLSIVHGFDANGAPAVGVAPASTDYAACLDGQAKVFTDVLETYVNEPEQFAYPVDHELKANYQARGWFWNDNWGFISLSCNGGKNSSGPETAARDYSCGAVNYGVYLGPREIVGGKARRDFFGYAWSENLGWIQFKGGGNDVEYGVYVNEAGRLVGHAWTEAGIYLDFTGAEVELLGVEFEEEEDADPEVDGGEEADGDEEEAYCDSQNTPICVELDPNPLDLSFNNDGDSDFPVADCRDGYKVKVFAKHANGDPMNLDGKDYDLASLDVIWTDTVRKDQIDQTAGTFSLEKNAWDDTAAGAVNYKPLTWNDFEEVLDEDGVPVPGEFISKAPVSSCAPTSDGNLSFTSKTNPKYPVRNEDFLSPEIIVDAPNRLELVRVAYGEIVDQNNVTVAGPGNVVANGKGQIPLKFRPVVEVNTLYEGDSNDDFVAHNNMKNFFQAAVRLLGDNEAYKNEAKLGTVSLEMYEPDCLAGPDAAWGFDFDKNFAGNDPDSNVISSTIGTLAGNQYLLEATPSANCDDPEVVDPAVYSKVEYTVSGKPIKYYNNKLPRLEDDDPNFKFHSLVIGKVNAEAFGEYRTSSAVPVDTSTLVNLNSIKSAISKNIAKLGIGFAVPPKAATCDVTKLKDDGSANPYEVGFCTKDTHYRYQKVGDEHVLYFENVNVALNLLGGDYDGKWNVIVQGDTQAGNIMIENSVYDDNPTNKYLNLVALQPWNGDRRKGNIYIQPCVDGFGAKNIQANLIADGSVFSYDPWNISFTDEGLPIWGSEANPDFSRMVEALSSCQLLVEGVISAQNTIGGALWGDGSRLLLGGGRVIDFDGPASLMKAQQYDIHYLRAFSAQVAFDEDGHPIDQNCGTGLTPEMLGRIANGEKVCGDIPGCDENDPNPQTMQCNGINAEELFVDGPGEDEGDLVPPFEDGELDQSVLSRGIFDNPNIPETEKYWPSYVFYRPLPSDSFLFEVDETWNMFAF